MIEEADISQEESWYYTKLAKRCLNGLAGKNIHGYHCPDTESARAKVLELVPPNVRVGFGDSVTLYQTGIIAELEKRKTNVLLHPFYHNGIAHYLEPLSEQSKKENKSSIRSFQI